MWLVYCYILHRPDNLYEKLTGGRHRMMFRTRSGYQSISVLLLMLVLAFSAAAQDDKKKDKDGKKPLTGTPVMWKDPTDLESRNLILGAGGEKMKPDISKVTFIEQKTGGFSTKYRVRDAKGNEWIAKIG